MPTSNVRDTLGDFVEQYAGYAQTTNTLGLANGVPRQTLRIRSRRVNPVSSRTVSRTAATRISEAPRPRRVRAAPQMNERSTRPTEGSVGGTVVELNYFFNYGTRVPYDKNLNMADPAFKLSITRRC